MVLSLADKRDKDEAHNLFQRIFQTFMFRLLTQPKREAILTHLKWMRGQTQPMNVTCKLETMPELGLTHIVIDVTYAPVRRRHDAHRGIQ